MEELIHDYEKNPIISPRPGYDWEVEGTLNPGVIVAPNYMSEEPVVNILYRAVAKGNYSTFGFAYSKDGYNIDYRSEMPVMVPELPEEAHGIEDPRLCQIGDMIYIVYTAYAEVDGKMTTRIALARTKDFKEYERIGIIGPDFNDKDAYFFPEPINGKICLVHRVEPSIQVAYFNNIDEVLRLAKDNDYRHQFWGNYFKTMHNDVMIHPSSYNIWGFEKVGGGSPPLKVGDHWLFIYHEALIEEEVDGKIYKATVALLDLDDPEKVVKFSPKPLMIADKHYEVDKAKGWDIIFPQGNVIIGDTLFIYSGGADLHVTLATASLTKLMEYLNENGVKPGTVANASEVGS